MIYTICTSSHCCCFLQRAQPEIVTFLGYESDNALYTIPGGYCCFIYLLVMWLSVECLLIRTFPKELYCKLQRHFFKFIFYIPRHWLWVFYHFLISLSKGIKFPLHVTSHCTDNRSLPTVSSQFTSEKHNQEKEAHKPLCTSWISHKMCLPCLIIIQSCYCDCRIYKPFAYSCCVICISCSVHLISDHRLFYLSCHKSTRSETLITWNLMQLLWRYFCTNE